MDYRIIDILIRYPNKVMKEDNSLCTDVMNCKVVNEVTSMTAMTMDGTTTNFTGPSK